MLKDFNKISFPGKELELLEEKRAQLVKKFQDTSVLDGYIDDIQDNLNYIQEKINETQQNVMEIEDYQDSTDTTNVQDVLNSIYHVDEAKYLIDKLLGMTLSKSNAVSQSDARLKENDAMLQVVNFDVYLNIIRIVIIISSSWSKRINLEDNY